MVWICAAAAAAFFALACYAAFSLLFPGKSAAPQPLPAPAGRDAAGERWVFCAALGFGAVVLAAVALSSLSRFPQAGPAALDWYFDSCALDARHYRDLALWGYGTEEAFFEQSLMIAFCPLFPWLMRPLVALGLPFYPAAMAVNLLLFSAGEALLFRVVRRRWDCRTAAYSALFLALMPGSFFFVLPMSEALFFFLCIAFLDALESRHLLLAGAAGALAALTRTPGALLSLLAAAALFGHWRQGARLRLCWLAPVAGPAVGVAGYLALNFALYGHPLQFLIVQREHWHNGPGMFWQTLRYLWEYTCSWWLGSRPMAIWYGIWQIGLILLQLVVLAAAARRLPAPWLLHALAYFAMVNGANWLLSAPRYSICMPALAPALALAAGGRRGIRIAAAVLLAAGWGIFFAVFLSGGPVC